MLQRDNNKKNRGTNTSNNRSVIFDDKNGQSYELIPRATLDELYEIAKALPTVRIDNIAKNTKHSGETRPDKRYYEIAIGAGGHSKVSLAREINSDGSYGNYIVVKKINSSEELFKTYSRSNSKRSLHSSRDSSKKPPQSSDLSMATDVTTSSSSSSSSSAMSSSSGSSNPGSRRRGGNRTLSKSTHLPTTPSILPDADVATQIDTWKNNARSTSTPKLFGDSKRIEIIASIERELQVNRLLANLDGVSLTASQVPSTKKKTNEMQLYQFTPYATLGDIQHFQEHIKSCLFNKAAANKLKTNITNQMILCIATLHTQSNVRHRDIKPDNFLLTAEGKVLLTDFGASVYLDENVNPPVWQRVSITTFIDATPSQLISRESEDGNFRLHDEWALAKAILDLWQISTVELGEIRQLEIYENPTDDEIKKRYAEYLQKIAVEMQRHEMPLHIRKFILAALEINSAKRKTHIAEIVDLNNLQGPNISEELTTIKSTTANYNSLFFTKSSSHDDKYKIEGVNLSSSNEVFGYDDDKMAVEYVAKNSPKLQRT